MFSDRLNHSTPDPWLEISVQDQGVGIEAEYLPRIFNEVLQINPNKNQGGQGTGMGLYISKGIAELHGGRVEVDSAGLGQGSCFKILLPLHLATPATATSVGEGIPHGVQSSLNEPDEAVGYKAATADSETQMKLISDTEMKRDHGSYIGESANLTTGSLPPPLELRDHRAGTDDNFNPSAKDTSSSSSVVVPGTLSGKGLTSNARLQGQKVLMVDDSPMNLKMCVKLLQRLGAVVEKAEDGRIAVTMVQALLPEQGPPPPTLGGERSDQRLHQMYDLVLMDNMMPHLTGVEACQAMRAMGFTGVIIGLTGNVFEKDIADYIANGANAVLHKPLVLADLFETLRKIDADSKV
jgi:CheY-like chemotaxis protein